MSPPHTLPPGEARGLKGGGGEAKFAESPPFPRGMEPLAVKHGGMLSPGRPGCGEGRGSSEDTCTRESTSNTTRVAQLTLPEAVPNWGRGMREVTNVPCVPWGL